jgi:hypothetical protein
MEPAETKIWRACQNSDTAAGEKTDDNPWEVSDLIALM